MAELLSDNEGTLVMLSGLTGGISFKRREWPHGRDGAPSAISRRRPAWWRGTPLLAAVLLTLTFADGVSRSAIADFTPSASYEEVMPASRRAPVPLAPAAFELALAMPSTQLAGFERGRSRLTPQVRSIAKGDRLVAGSGNHKITMGIMTVLFSVMMFVVMVMWRRLGRSAGKMRVHWEDWR